MLRTPGVMRRVVQHFCSRRPVLLVFVLFVVASAPLGGCAAHLKSAAAEAPKTVVPAAVDASLSSLEEPLTRERILAVAGTPEMQQVVRDLGRSALEGALEAALQDPSIDREGLRRAIRQAVTEATRASLRAGEEEFMHSLTPAMRRSVVETLGAPEVREAVSTTVSSSTRAAVISTFDLMKELHEHEATPELFSRLRRLLIGVVAGAFGLGAGSSALLAWTLGLHRRAQRMREREGAKSPVKTGTDAPHGETTS
jgi:hypothetical protein